MDGLKTTAAIILMTVFAICEDVRTQSLSKSHTTLSLKSFIAETESRYQVYFIYESDLIHLNPQRIPINLLDDGIEGIINTLGELTQLTFHKVSSKTYAVRSTDRTGHVTGTIKDAQGRPLAGATIYVPLIERGAATTLDGTYRLELPPGIWPITYSYVGWQEEVITQDVIAGSEYVKDVILRAQPYLSEVTIVGSRISPSTMIDNATLVTITSPEVEKGRWFSELGDLLQSKVPSFHSTRQTIADGTDHIDPAALRGLGPDQVLVLVNGKRRHQSSLVNINGTVGKGTVSTDLNAIPLSAIERIEVLQDGGAVQYGSDAIAGVINVILKKNIVYNEISFKTGVSHRGDGGVVDLSSNFGFAITEGGGHLDLSLNYLNRDHVNRSSGYEGVIFGDQRDTDPIAVRDFHNATGYSDNRIMSIGGAAMSAASFFFNLGIPIVNDDEIYAFGGASYKDGQASGFYRLPYRTSSQSGLYEFGFSPSLDSDIGDQSLSIGINKKLKNWKVDVSNTTGRNSFDMRVINSNNASLGLNSPSSADVGGFSYVQNTTNIDAQIENINNTNIDLSIGTEYRIESYEQHQGEEVSWQDYGHQDQYGRKEAGFQMFPGFRPENDISRTRQNLGAYLNVEMDLTKSLKLGLANRYSTYSDFGGNLSWRLYGRYRIGANTILKMSWNTGFRAPSMPQIYFSTFSSQFITTSRGQESTRVAQFNNESLITREFGIEPLKPEKSKNFNLGMALRPQKNLSFTINAYRIDISDRIVVSGRFNADQDETFAEILAPLGISQAQFFSNAVDTRTQGLESSVNYQLQLENGLLDLAASASLVSTRLGRDGADQVVVRTSDILENFQSTLFNREEVSRLESAQPSGKIILSAKYGIRKLDVALQTTRYGSVTYIHPLDGNPAAWVLDQSTGTIRSRDQTFSPKWITDLNITYYISNSISASIGGSNIFSIYPDEHSHSANRADGLFPYSRRVQQFNLRGAYWYGRVGVRF